jgi:hypothetical protein
MTPVELASLFGLTKAAYSRKETQEKLSLGQTKIDQLIADGTLKSIKVGEGRTSKRLILAVSIAELLAQGLTINAA